MHSMQIQGSTVHIDQQLHNKVKSQKMEEPVNGHNFSHKGAVDGTSRESDVRQQDSDINPVHREIIEKLKHEEKNSQSPRLEIGSQEISLKEADRKRLLEYQAAAAAFKYNLPNNLMPSPASDHMLRQSEALYALHNGRPKLDYLSQLALLHEQQKLLVSNSKSRSQSPPTGSDESEADSIPVETLSPPHNSGQWTYEEQFKQLYELGNEPERKPFLDDLFAFMQKRGTPVNRIPIMAKNTLDIFKLHNLVVAKGGLVEVINKKLWREITKGLVLPTSITSAAFTLRTQYMKYIYPYECDRYGFSTPNELQAAIDGNRREGRRPGYGYELSPSTLPPSFYNPNALGANPFFNPLMGSSMASMLNTTMAHNFVNGQHTPARINGISSTGSSAESREEVNHSPILVASPRLANSAFTSTRPAPDSEIINRDFKRLRKTADSPVHSDHTPSPNSSEHNLAAEIMKRNGFLPSSLSMTIGNTHLNITTHIDGKSGFDSSMVASIEFNGNMFQGVLFAQPKKH